MTIRLNRLVLGGVLTSVVFLLVAQAALAQEPTGCPHSAQSDRSDQPSPCSASHTNAASAGYGYRTRGTQAHVRDELERWAVLPDPRQAVLVPPRSHGPVRLHVVQREPGPRKWNPARQGNRKFNDGVNLRRARVFAEGTLYSNIDYKFELEFANGIGFSPAGTTNETNAGSITNSPGPTDAWMTIKDVPFFGNLRIGNQKEWFSLEHLNNYRALEFLERSYLFDLSQPTAFDNGFSPGVSTFRTWADDRIFTGMGVYKNISDLLGFGIGDGQYAVSGRLAALPIWRPDDKIFWHVGGAISHRDPVDDRVQVRIRDNIRNAPFPLLPLLVNTNLLEAESQDLYNLETAAVCGPWTFQAEYTATTIHNVRQAATSTTPAGPPQGTIFFQGYYARDDALPDRREPNLEHAVFLLQSREGAASVPIQARCLRGSRLRGVGSGLPVQLRRYVEQGDSGRPNRFGDVRHQLVFEHERQASAQLRLHTRRRQEQLEPGSRQRRRHPQSVHF